MKRSVRLSYSFYVIIELIIIIKLKLWLSCWISQLNFLLLPHRWPSDRLRCISEKLQATSLIPQKLECCAKCEQNAVIFKWTVFTGNSLTKCSWACSNILYTVTGSPGCIYYKQTITKYLECCIFVDLTSPNSFIVQPSVASVEAPLNSSLQLLSVSALSFTVWRVMRRACWVWSNPVLIHCSQTAPSEFVVLRQLLSLYCHTCFLFYTTLA